jgi:hypothetical protein
MVERLIRWIERFFGTRRRQPDSAKPDPAAHVMQPAETAQYTVGTVVAELVPYDEHLLERSRTQWQFGDWESLASLERNQLLHHPDRARLAIFAAAGRLQLGQNDDASALVRAAIEWGASKRLVSQMLISGVHNNLARALTVVGEPAHALQHFEAAIAVGAPSSDARLLVHARKTLQLDQMREESEQFRLAFDRAESSLPRNERQEGP